MYLKTSSTSNSVSYASDIHQIELVSSSGGTLETWYDINMIAVGELTQLMMDYAIEYEDFTWKYE